MPTANARKGDESERMVARYLREHGFPLADRRLREGRADDQGDIDGVPYTTIQVKYWAENRLQAWVTDTLRQRDMAGTPLCLLIARKKYRAVAGWDAYMPSVYFVASFEDAVTGYPVGDHLPEAEAWTWMRMDLALAVHVLHRTTKALAGLSRLSSRTTSTHGMGRVSVTKAPASAPSMENESPRSPTT